MKYFDMLFPGQGKEYCSSFRLAKMISEFHLNLKYTGKKIYTGKRCWNLRKGFKVIAKIEEQ